MIESECVSAGERKSGGVVHWESFLLVFLELRCSYNCITAPHIVQITKTKELKKKKDKSLGGVCVCVLDQRKEGAATATLLPQGEGG